MYKPLQVHDVFEASYAKHVRDTGDCWIWTGAVRQTKARPVPRFGSFTVRSVAMKRHYNKDTSQHCVYLAACENDRCVHPEHLAESQSDVGRLLFIKSSSRPQGECRIWTGMLTASGWPKLAMPRSTYHTNISVHRFVYSQERGIPPVKSGVVDMSCKNQLCVSHKHIEIEFRPSSGLCPDGHKLPVGSVHCRVGACGDGELQSRCPQGHALERSEAAFAGKVGCWYCRADDAAEFIRERNAEALKTGRL